MKKPPQNQSHFSTNSEYAEYVNNWYEEHYPRSSQMINQAYEQSTETTLGWTHMLNIIRYKMSEMEEEINKFQSERSDSTNMEPRTIKELEATIKKLESENGTMLAALMESSEQVEKSHQVKELLINNELISSDTYIKVEGVVDELRKLRVK